MSTLRKIVDEKDARACLSSVARSGEALRAWAKRHRVDGRSLHAWKRNLSRGTAATASCNETRLVEFVPVSSISPRPRKYVVRVGEASVEVGDDFDPGTLRRLVEVLRAC